MTEIDLIPSDYRTRVWQRRWLRVAGAAAGALFAAHAIVFVAIAHKTQAIEAEVAELESRQQISQQQRAELEELYAKRADYTQQEKLLNGLRSGATAEELFRTVERALDSDDVWFVDWRFQRSGVVVESAEDAISTGYFIVVPAEENASDTAPWQVRTHMTIRGRSRDHSALSGFVRNLFAQAEVEDVHLGRTSMSRVGRSEIVDFDLAVVVNTDVRTR